jgi:hypothetical protein
MIEAIKSQNDAYNLKDQFVRWLDEERGIGCTENDIAVTADTVDGFKNACREIEAVAEVEAIAPDYERLQGGHIIELTGTQRCKGESRKDLYILDTGKYRLVLAV